VAFSMAWLDKAVEAPGAPGDRAQAPAAELAAFRDVFYGCLTARADALFELCDAALCADGPVVSLAELSLSPVFRRGHGALYDALGEGGLDADRLREALVAALPEDLPMLFAVDVSSYPRPDAECSPGRTHCHAPCRCDGKRKTIPGWAYSRAAGLEWGSSSWVHPVDAVRLGPADGLVEVTADQIRGLVGRLRAAGRVGGPDQPVPMAILDCGYPAPAISHALADVDVQLLIRLGDEKRRVFYTDPPPPAPGKPGRPRRHGDRRELSEADTWPLADQAHNVDTDRYGRVEVRAWHGLHQKLQARGHFAGEDAPEIVKGTVIQVKVERLPDGRLPHKTLWLWWTAPAGTPCDLDVLWRAYLRRFDAEHGFRFDKTVLGWTRARLRAPEQADLWTWLIIAAYTQLRLARHLTADLRRPWERPPRPGKAPSPTRVRRGFQHILPQIGTPARAPKPTKAGPGRPKGSRSGPAPRHQVAKKAA
jgi:DDE superfamily endonuclease